jgi:hypothetical protein
MSQQPNSSTVSRHVGIAMVSKTIKRNITKCSQEIERLPLEALRLPKDGRKWKQSARSRSGLLLRLSVKANPDGTFIGANGQNFSPSFERLSKHVSRGSYTRLTNDLRDLGLLSWIREKHYDRRVYTIHLPEHSQDSPKQYPDSLGTLSTLGDETQNQYPDSSKSVSTMVRIPSLPTEKRADKSIPTPEPNQKPETAIAAPSAEVKTNPKGADKEESDKPDPARQKRLAKWRGSYEDFLRQERVLATASRFVRAK